MVPRDALVLDTDGTRLFSVQRAGNVTTVRSIDVQTGSTRGELIEVIGDVQPGDEIVTQGNERLRHGQEVKVLKDARY